MKLIYLLSAFLALLLFSSASKASYVSYYCNNDAVDVNYNFGGSGITFEKKNAESTVGFIYVSPYSNMDCFLANLVSEYSYTVVRLTAFIGEPNFEGVMHSMPHIAQWNVGGYKEDAERAFQFVNRVYPKQYGWVGIDPQFTNTTDYSRLVGRFLWIGNSGSANMTLLPPQLWKVSADTGSQDFAENSDALGAVSSAFLFSKIDAPRSEAWAFIDRKITDLQTFYHDGADTPGYFHIPAASGNEQQTTSRNALLYVPGGAVDSRAYLEQLKGVAAAGYHVFVEALPFGNALIYSNVNGIYQRILSEKGHLFDKLSIAGHSLGSLGAGNLVVNYSPKKQSGSKVQGYINVSCVCGVNVTQAVDTQDSIFGTRDLFPTSAFYQHVEDYMNPDTTITVIEGANHAQMSGYNIRYTPGASDNGNLAEVSRADQHQAISNAMINHLDSL